MLIRKHISPQFKTYAAQCFLWKQNIFFQKNNVYLKQKNNKDKSIGTITLFCEGFAPDFGVFCPFIQQSTCEVRQWCWTRRPGPQSPFQLTPKVLDGLEGMALCSPVHFFHTRLIQPCLYGLCFVHWGTVMLQKRMTCSHKVGSIAFSKKCWWSIRIPSLLQSPVVASFTPPHLMRGIVFGDVRLGSICSAMKTHSMKLPPEFLCWY